MLAYRSPSLEYTGFYDDFLECMKEREHDE